VDARLNTIAKLIRSTIHVDIGSDDARLLVSLLQDKRIERGIAIENKLQPFENSRNALANFNADVRLGEGLDALKPLEAQSLSVSGMGAETIVEILGAYPDRVPRYVVLQPNRRPEIVRRWALRNGFHIVDEQIVFDDRIYTVMSFRASPNSNNFKNDPAYRNVERAAALLFGPLLLKRADANLARQLREEENYWKRLEWIPPENRKRLSIIRKLREW
jgi:tRNA (adenine22-N1)-methyltransferase